MAVFINTLSLGINRQLAIFIAGDAVFQLKIGMFNQLSLIGFFNNVGGMVENIFNTSAILHIHTVADNRLLEQIAPLMDMNITGQSLKGVGQRFKDLIFNLDQLCCRHGYWFRFGNDTSNDISNTAGDLPFGDIHIAVFNQHSNFFTAGNILGG